MEIIYEDNAIIDVQVANPKLNARMTQQERLAVFGCAQPDATTLTALQALEKGLDYNGHAGTIADVADAMVSAGSVTSQRGAEIKA